MVSGGSAAKGSLDSRSSEVDGSIRGADGVSVGSSLMLRWGSLSVWEAVDGSTRRPLEAAEKLATRPLGLSA